MTLNKRRKYSNIKPFNDLCSTALHESTDKYVESLGATIRTGSEMDFVRLDRDELRTMIVEKNRRTLDRLVEAIKLKNQRCEGFAEKVEARMTEIKHPEDSQENG